jgi:iron complex outermembrane receptor protein
VDLGIPGRPEARFALVPPGRNAAQLEPGAFVETDPTAVVERRQGRVVLRRPTESFNFNVQLEHTVAPETFELYGELGYARADERFSAPDAIEPLALSATDPRNPFRNGVTPGFPGRSVTLHFDPVDLPDASFQQMRDSVRAVVGARGAVGRHWNWVLDGFVDLSRSRANVHSYGASLNDLLRAWTPFRSEALATIYDPLADHRAAPVSNETRQRLLAQYSWLDYRSLMTGADFRVGGQAFELPAGPVRFALGAEYSWRNLTTRQQAEASRELYTLIGATSTFDTLTQLRSTDDRGHRVGGLAEAVVPLYRAGRQRTPLQSAELNLATRAARTDGGRPAWSSLAALKLAPSTSWALRGTVSQGHVTPESALVYSPVVETTTTVGVRDPLRGGGAQIYPLKIIRGGSRALRAETSQARVVGVLFTPAAAPGLFVSVDAWSIIMKDRLRVPTVQEMVDHAEFFPGKIERGAPLPWEFVLGWAGPVTSVDLRPVHVTRLRAEGVDVAFRYRLPPARAGTFTFSGQLEIVQRYEEQFLPATPAIDKVDVVADASSDGLMESAVVSPRGRAAVGWQRGPWSASLGMTYTPPYRTETTTPTAALPAATGLDGDFIGSSTRWDFQTGYSVRGRREGIQRWFSDTTWTLGVRNVFDAEPPYRSDGTSFYSRFDDPRMRFLYLRVQWRR